MVPAILASCFLGCAKSDVALDTQKLATTRDAQIALVVAQMQIPSSGKLTYQGSVIADLSSNTPINSPYGTVSRGTTLNPITISGVDFLVYGEDGVFAAECEAHPSYPDHGPTHPLCEIAHAESFDRIILCSASASDQEILVAQNWPGLPTAMTGPGGLTCWNDGVLMRSKKIFTY